MIGEEERVTLQTALDYWDEEKDRALKVPVGLGPVIMTLAGQTLANAVAKVLMEEAKL